MQFQDKDIYSKQKIEVEFWRDSRHESPEADSVLNMLKKSREALIFLEGLKRHRKKISKKGRVLELGAGQGWGACVYKRLFPRAHVTATDISQYAVMSLPKWERIFQVSLDNAYACKSYEINEADASLDLVFCFASAHHFLAHKRTLEELYRVLKPGGKGIYFYEPAAPKIFYRLARRRMNRKRSNVPEDVLIVSEIARLSRQAGLDLHVDYHPSLQNRDPLATVYFYFLGLMPFLQKFLPCSVNLVFTKPGSMKRKK